ncbi:MAG TPA: DNA polymerase Y family protein [Caulobacteraceae bacterium]|nr:DNA polymerase Y family protein [Caulobacteraceae bacterium]
MSIDRTRRDRPELGTPLALIARQASAVRLQALDPAALALGLDCGLTLSDARAQVPRLKAVDADPAADRRALRAIAELCRRYTPSLALDPPDGVDLNVTGSGPLFGGEAALARDLVARLARLGFSARYGLADTPGLARALARFGEAPIAGVGEREGVLAPLPMAALRLEPQTLAMLRGLGLRRVGQILQAKVRPALARRLGEAVLQRLDEALGTRAAPLRLRLEVSPWMAERRLAEPVAMEDQVLRLVGALAGRLAERLEARRLGGRLYVLELHRVDGAVKRLAVAASRPLRDPARIAALFAERIAVLNEGLEADYGFDLVRLWARRVQPFDARPAALLQQGAGEAGFAALVDRLSARLGQGAVRRLVPVAQTRLPERAVRAVPFEPGAAPAWAGEPAASEEGAPLRPITLFAPPQPIEVTAVVPEGAPDRFKWRRVLRRIVAAEGPERLEPEWGRSHAAPRVRDYYRLEDEEGRRYWVFREGRYGQGPEAPEPRWFLHGLFP